MKNTKAKAKSKAKSKKLYSFDAQKNKKLRRNISAASVLTAAIMLVIGFLIVPIRSLYDVPSLGAFLWRAAIIVLGMAACLVIHEEIHLIVMKRMTGKSAEAGFENAYPYIGSSESFGKRSYLIISLAPIVIIGAVLLALLFIVPKSWFWVVYIIFIMHISGSVGDFYCAYKIITEKNSIRIKDEGKSVEIWKA